MGGGNGKRVISLGTHCYFPLGDVLQSLWGCGVAGNAFAMQRDFKYQAGRPMVLK